MNHSLRTTLLFLTIFPGFLWATNPNPPIKSNKLEFVANQGQWPSPVQYKATLQGGALFLHRDGYTLALRHPDDVAWMKEHHHGDGEAMVDAHENAAERLMPTPSGKGKQIRYEALKVKFLNGGADRVDGEEQRNYHHNYFIGNDPTKWASSVPVFDGVKMHEVYQGIDLKMYSDDVLPKYDWILAPGANPDDIQIQYQGVAQMHVLANRLVIHTQYNEWVEERPLAYQMINGQKVEVPCEYRLMGTTVSFAFPEGYDQTAELIIDPLLVFSTYTGSIADNWGFTACFDDGGNLYSGSMVFGTGYPVSIGAYQEDFSGAIDIGIFSFDSAGTSQRYATYLGGTDGEAPQSLLVGPDSSLVVLGISSSPDYPTTASAFQSTFQGGDYVSVYNDGRDFNSGTDIVITRLSYLGHRLEASTYVGGSGNDGYKDPGNPLTFFYGDDFRGDVIADANGNIYVASTTQSADFPTGGGFQSAYGGGAQDGLVFSMPPALNTMRWSNYLGGVGEDAVYSIKLDEDGTVLVGGGTTSSNFPGVRDGEVVFKPGDVDGFVTRISANGQEVIRGTYLGTFFNDQVYFVDIDTARQVYALGTTFGSYPVQGDVYSVANSGQFVHQFVPGLDSTNWSTTIGGGISVPEFSPTAFLVNECGNIYISGWSGSLGASGYFGTRGFDLPVTPDAFQSTTDGSDFYISVLNRQASELLYGSFFGENGANDHVDGGTSRFDKRGIVYQSVCASCGGSNGFPITPGAWSASNRSSNCNNGIFKFDLSSIQAILDTNTPEGDFPGIRVGCAPFTVVFENDSEGGLEFVWDFGDGDQLVQSTKQNVTYTYPDPGVYDVTLTVIDANTCQVRDSASVQITVTEENFAISDDTEICLGEQTQLQASGGVDYRWIPPFGLSDDRAANPVASPAQTTTYTLTAFDAAGCRFRDSVTVDVIGDIGAAFDATQTVACQDDNLVEFQNLTTNGNSFSWDFGDGATSTDRDPTHEYAENGTYTVTLSVDTEGCRAQVSRNITIKQLNIPTVFTPNTDTYNETLQINTLEPVGLVVANRWGEVVFEAETYNNEWTGEGFPDGVYMFYVQLHTGESCRGMVNIIR